VSGSLSDQAEGISALALQIRVNQALATEDSEEATTKKVGEMKRGENGKAGWIGVEKDGQREGKELEMGIRASLGNGRFGFLRCLASASASSPSRAGDNVFSPLLVCLHCRSATAQRSARTPFNGCCT
jgi:hypothetical protein